MDTDVNLRRCPKCGSSKLYWLSSDVGGDNDTLSMPVNCQSCGLSWVQVYDYSYSTFFMEDGSDELDKPGGDWVDKHYF